MESVLSKLVNNGVNLVIFCPASACSDNHFQCDYGVCVTKDKYCDGFFDCGDHSDELNCGMYKFLWNSFFMLINI